MNKEGMEGWWVWRAIVITTNEGPFTIHGADSRHKVDPVLRDIEGGPTIMCGDRRFAAAPLTPTRTPSRCSSLGQ